MDSDIGINSYFFKSQIKGALTIYCSTKKVDLSDNSVSKLFTKQKVITIVMDYITGFYKHLVHLDLEQLKDLWKVEKDPVAKSIIEYHNNYSLPAIQYYEKNKCTINHLLQTEVNLDEIERKIKNMQQEGESSLNNGSDDIFVDNCDFSFGGDTGEDTPSSHSPNYNRPGDEEIRKKLGDVVKIGNRSFFSIDIENVTPGDTCGNKKFEHISNAATGFVSFAMKYGLSGRGVMELDEALEPFETALNLKNIYDESFHKVLHESALASLSVSFRFCTQCQDMYRTNRVFCQYCGFPFLKRCSSCKITEAKIREIEENDPIGSTLECNCPDCTPNDTLILYAASWEGFLCELHSFGFIDKMMACTPSTQLLLSEFCQRIGCITSVTDGNSARLWKHIGKEEVCSMMEHYLQQQVPNSSSDPLNSLNVSNEENPEELLFHSKTKVNLYNAFHNGTLTLETVESDITQFISEIETLIRSFPNTSFPIIETGKNILDKSIDDNALDQVCGKARHCYQEVYSLLKAYYEKGGLFHKIGLVSNKYMELGIKMVLFEGKISSDRVKGVSSSYYSLLEIAFQTEIQMKVSCYYQGLVTVRFLCEDMCRRCDKYLSELSKLDNSDASLDLKRKYFFTVSLFDNMWSDMIKKCDGGLKSLVSVLNKSDCSDGLQKLLAYLKCNTKLRLKVNKVKTHCNSMEIGTSSEIYSDTVEGCHLIECYSNEALVALFGGGSVSIAESLTAKEGGEEVEDEDEMIPLSIPRINEVDERNEVEIINNIAEMIETNNSAVTSEKESSDGSEEMDVEKSSTEPNGDEAQTHLQVDGVTTHEPVTADSQETRVRRSTRAFAVNPKYSTAKNFSSYILTTAGTKGTTSSKKKGRGKGGRGIANNKKREKAEKKELQNKITENMKKSCSSSVLLEELQKKNKADDSLFNSQKITPGVKKTNIAGGKEVKNQVEFHKNKGFVKNYSSGMKKIGDNYKNKGLSLDPVDNSSAMEVEKEVQRESTGSKDMDPFLLGLSAVREYLPPEVLDHSVGYRKEAKDIEFSYKCPPNYTKAVVRLITFNLFADGVKVFNSIDHGSVYAISITVNNSPDKLRNTPSQTCRLLTIPSSDGSKSNPIFRRCLGMIVDAINEMGKVGFYILDKEDDVLYHYYYGIHCYCGDLIAGMQLFDRPSCGMSNVPCFQYECAAGVYNPILHKYTYPEHNLSRGTAEMKNIGRFLTHFENTSIYRAAPLVACYANEELYPSKDHPDKEKNIVKMVEELMSVTLREIDKEKLLSLFRFYQSLGSNLFLHTPIEDGDEERRHFEMVLDNEDTPLHMRTNLVNVKNTTPLDHDAIFGFDYMHGVSNASTRIVSYILGYYLDKNDASMSLKEEVIKYLNDNKDISGLLPYWYSVPDSVVVEASQFLDRENNAKKDSLLRKENILIRNNFKHLKCHDKMLFSFQAFPLVYGHALHISVIRLCAYALQIIADLYSLNSDLERANFLQEQLLVVLGTIEGLVYDHFSTISIHMFAHSFKTILQAGPLKNLDTYYTEHSYQLDSDILINSRNVIKTLGLRMLFMTYSNITTFYYRLEKKYIKENQNNQFVPNKNCFVEWEELFINEGKLLKYLTKQNFQDDYVYSRCDITGFRTTLDIFCSNGFQIEIDAFPSDVYFNSTIWDNAVFNNYVQSSVYYEGKYYYAFNYSNTVTVDTFLKETRSFAFMRGFKKQLSVFVMLGFVVTKVNSYDYVQAICYNLPTFTPLLVNSPLMAAVKIEDLLTLNKSRLCLVSCNVLTHNKGRFSTVPNEKYLVFRTNTINVFQSKVMKLQPIFDTLPLR